MASSRPNVLFLFTDDQRFDTIGALGNPHVHTPNLDALVSRGVAFRNAYIMGGTCGAVCMPSRAMLHTGRGLFHIQRFGQQVPDDHMLMGEAFRQAGYETFGTGKWHNGKAAFQRSFRSGDEIFFGGMSDHWNVPAFHYDPTGTYEPSLPVCVNAFDSNEVKWRDADHMRPGTHSTDLFTEATIRFLRTRTNKYPFFAYTSFMAPHDPRTMPKRFLDIYDPDAIPLPENYMPAHPFDNGELRIRDEKLETWPRTPEAIRRHLAEYYAMISHIDDAVGRILAELEAQGLMDNTIVVFAGDNGLALGRHGLMGKQSLYEHSIHVPMLFAGPGIETGEQTDAFAYLSDIFPTLCGLADVAVPESVEGRSLAPVLRSPQTGGREEMYYAYRDKHRAVRIGSDKLVEYSVNGRRRTQLFDVTEDPFEMRDLAAQPESADTVAALRSRLLELRREHGDTREEEAAFWETWDVG